MPSRILEPLLRALCAIAVAALVACASPRGVARNASADAEVGRHLQRG